jgi:hypothetical protein
MDRAIASVLENGLYLRHFDRFKDNPEVVLPAVQQNGLALQFASYHLRSDESIVMAAVQQNGKALEFASYSLKNDDDVVMAAVKNNPVSLQFARENPRDNDAIVLYAVGERGECIDYASDRLRNAILLKRVTEEPGYISAIKKSYITREIALAAVSQDGMLFSSLPHNIVTREIVDAAVKNNGLVIHQLSPELQADEEVVMAAVQQNGEALLFSKYKHPLITMIASLNGYVPTPRDIEYVYPYMSRMIASQLPSDSPENVTKRRELGTVDTLANLYKYGPHFHKKFKRLIDSFADARYVRTPNEDMTNTVEQYEKDIANQFNEIYAAEIAQEKARIQTFTGEIHRAADKLSRSRNVFGGRRTRRTQNQRHRGKPL